MAPSREWTRRRPIYSGQAEHFRKRQEAGRVSGDVPGDVDGREESSAAPACSPQHREAAEGQAKGDLRKAVSQRQCREGGRKSYDCWRLGLAPVPSLDPPWRWNQHWPRAFSRRRRWKLEIADGPAHRRLELDGVSIFYREAGRADAPVLLLPHGYAYADVLARVADALGLERYALWLRAARLVEAPLAADGYARPPESGGRADGEAGGRPRLVSALPGLSARAPATHANHLGAGGRPHAWIEPDQRILVEWSGYGYPTPIEWIFTDRPDGTTFVQITNKGFQGSVEEVAQMAVNATEGFSFVLAGAKAWLEHGIQLNLVRDRFPDGLPRS